MTKETRRGRAARRHGSEPDVGWLAEGIAHEFKNVLLGVHGAVQVLEEALPPEGSIRTLAHEVARSVDRGLELTYLLQTLGTCPPQPPRPVAIDRVAQDLEPLLRNLLRARSGTAQAGEPELVLALGTAPEVRAPGGSVERLLLNLVLNAGEASAPGSRIEIRTGAISISSEEDAERLGIPPGEYGLVSVSDWGCGMDEETRRRAFEPRFTTKRSGLGSGLGLTVVARLAQDAGGAVDLESAPGAGTVVRVALPAAAPTVPRAS